jgi:predicted nucleic acid-binding protein
MCKSTREEWQSRLADSLIAQNCVDAGVSLITRDRDFRAFAQTAGLHLIVAP